MNSTRGGAFVLAFCMLIGTASVVAGPEDEYVGSVKVDSQSNDHIANGKDLDEPFATFTVEAFDAGGDDGAPNNISIYYPSKALWLWRFDFDLDPIGKVLAPGTWEGQWGGDPDTPGVRITRAQNNTSSYCIAGKGTFTIVEAKFSKSDLGELRYHADKFHVLFDVKCVTATANLKGSLIVQNPGETDPTQPNPDPDQPPAEDPPPPPPPVYVQIVAPVSGVSLGNMDETSVAVATIPRDGYEGEIHLQAFAPPGIEVTFDPATILAPGSGSTVMTVRTSEFLLPMRHLIEIRASGPPRSASFVMPVEVLCEPPFVRALDVPDEVVVPQGGSTELRIDVTGSAPLRYQWYEGPRGSLWRPIEGATSNRVSIGPINGTSHYWLRITNGCGTWDSPTIRVGNKPSRARAVRK